MFEIREKKLDFEFKRMLSNTWEIQVRELVRECCNSAQTVDQFVTGFNYSLGNYRTDSYKSIHDTYRAEKKDSETAQVVWKNFHKGPGYDKTVAVIKPIKDE
ncbi:hypothetical protein [Sphingobacterium luzhongxinii]|uniref:hypothetical protein n=1 Tax=Sphingobacterium luzhongxinii TaxID=2654181 RepID=UPI0013DC524D|nr:hypothetical protein [Sphingobacterium sp. xlx-73]